MYFDIFSSLNFIIAVIIFPLFLYLFFKLSFSIIRWFNRH